MESNFVEKHSDIGLFQRVCEETIQSIVWNTFSQSAIGEVELDFLRNLEDATYRQILCHPEVLHSKAALDKLFTLCVFVADDSLSDAISSIFHKRFSDVSPIQNTDWYPNSGLLIRCLYLLGADLKYLKSACECGDPTLASAMSEVVSFELTVHDEMRFEKRDAASDTSRLQRRLMTLVNLYRAALCNDRRFQLWLSANGDQLVLLVLVVLQLAVTGLCDRQLLKHTVRQLLMLLRSENEQAAQLFDRNFCIRLLSLADLDLHRVVYLLLFTDESLAPRSVWLRPLLHSCLLQLLFENLLQVEVQVVFSDQTLDSIGADLSFDRLWSLICYVRDFWLRSDGMADQNGSTATTSRRTHFGVQHVYLSLLLFKTLVDGQIARRLVSVDCDVTEEQMAEDGRAFVRFVSHFFTLHSSIPDGLRLDRLKFKRKIREVEKDWEPLATQVSRTVNTSEEMEMLPLQFIRPDVKAESESEEDEKPADCNDVEQDYFDHDSADQDGLPFIGSQ